MQTYSSERYEINFSTCINNMVYSVICTVLHLLICRLRAALIFLLKLNSSVTCEVGDKKRYGNRNLCAGKGAIEGNICCWNVITSTRCRCTAGLKKTSRLMPSKTQMWILSCIQTEGKLWPLDCWWTDWQSNMKIFYFRLFSKRSKTYANFYQLCHEKKYTNQITKINVFQSFAYIKCVHTRYAETC